MLRYLKEFFNFCLYVLAGILGCVFAFILSVQFLTPAVSETKRQPSDFSKIIQTGESFVKGFLKTKKKEVPLEGEAGPPTPSPLPEQASPATPPVDSQADPQSPSSEKLEAPGLALPVEEKINQQESSPAQEANPPTSTEPAPPASQETPPKTKEEGGATPSEQTPIPSVPSDSQTTPPVAPSPPEGEAGPPTPSPLPEQASPATPPVDSQADPQSPSSEKLEAPDLALPEQKKEEGASASLPEQAPAPTESSKETEEKTESDLPLPENNDAVGQTFVEITAYMAPYIYEPLEKADPFEDPTVEIIIPDGGSRMIKTPPEEYTLEEIKLKGIIWDTKSPRALFKLPNQNDFYTLSRGAKIGKNGIIFEIREDEVVIVETTKNIIADQEPIQNIKILRLDRLKL